MAISNSARKPELREMVQSLEKLQAEAVTNRHQFLAYLLDMARMEAVSLLSRQHKET
ncbi:MAG: hypothetical protein GY948_01750 [Alphaproteobacteria bacterium]|nr:hypothetical protein [Alphaproteobacteria bacterium]